MVFREIEQGIAAIQAGNHEEGARLLRIALKNEQLVGNMRAVTLIWLAETTDERQVKATYYNEALSADPGNEHARQRLSALYTANLPPTPQHPATPQTPPVSSGYTPPPAAPAPYQPTTGYTPPPSPPHTPLAAAAPQAITFRVLGVIGGPNGPGSAFFVTRDGLLATTRYVTGSKEHLTIELEPGRQVAGQTVRSFPELDLAFISIGNVSANPTPITRLSYVPDNSALIAEAYNGQRLVGKQRATKRLLAPHWFPTTFDKLVDAGGSPMFDDQGNLVGMLTRDSSRSSAYLFGLHITAIYRAYEAYVQEMRGDPSRIYCPACGSLSRAPSVRGFYCETCGSILPHARETTRFPVPQAEALYGENNVMHCPHCGSRVGFHNDACLRCGGAVTI